MDRPFKPIESGEKANELLSMASREHASTMIWTKDQSIVLDTLFGDYSRSQSTLRVKLKIEDLPKTQKLDADQECFFSVSVSAANIFFKTPLLEKKYTELAFSIPEVLYEVQRRKDPRLPMGERKLFIGYSDPRDEEKDPWRLISKRVLDLSAGGLSLQVPESESSHYAVGQILENVTLILQDRKICCDGEIRHIRTQDAKTRIGITFMGLQTKDKSYIVTHVLEEIQKVISSGL
jgi:c-di-GMP-binding flagellar brake protein YcgR